ncbi:phosphodiester glycosidase family protein [Sunxiuqinia sp. sy24]|uniref:phosphodiester glycosidase family protein n=1 Tax=Sunxiuqinia sp. sy24 TaxID=3461495 RepID=UPI0040462F8C
MRKYIVYLSVLIVLSFFTNCKEDKLYITDEPGYTFETVETTELENGCKLLHIQEEKTPWNIYAIEIDLTNPKNQIELAMANDLAAWGTVANRETLASIVERKEANGKEVVAGINGDFFEMEFGKQFVTTVHDGKIGSTGITGQPHAALMVDTQGVPYIGLADLQSKLIIGASERAINSYNGTRWADNLVVYNGKMKDGNNQSGANPWGAEVLIEAVNKTADYVNGTFEYKVLEVDNVMDNVRVTMTDPENQLILSGHGAAREYIMNLTVGETVKIQNTYAGIDNEIKIAEVAGGWGHIVKEGMNNSIQAIQVEGTMVHEKQRHPRSCIGYNKDKTKFYMVAIEGRSDLSKGMSLDEIAYFMAKKFEVWDALNLDGGGSSTLMYGAETANTLSDGAQRATTNSIIVLSK